MARETVGISELEAEIAAFEKLVGSLQCDIDPYLKIIDTLKRAKSFGTQDVAALEDLKLRTKAVYCRIGQFNKNCQSFSRKLREVGRTADLAVAERIRVVSEMPVSVETQPDRKSAEVEEPATESAAKPKAGGRKKG